MDAAEIYSHKQGLGVIWPARTVCQSEHSEYMAEYNDLLFEFEMENVSRQVRISYRISRGQGYHSFERFQTQKTS